MSRNLHELNEEEVQQIAIGMSDYLTDFLNRTDLCAGSGAGYSLYRAIEDAVNDTYHYVKERDQRGQLY